MASIRKSGKPFAVAPKEVAAGAAFIALALLFLGQMQGLSSGSLARIGPALFPKLAAWSLLGVGIWQLLRGLGLRRGAAAHAPIGAWGLRGIFGIGAAICCFAAALAWGGGFVLGGSACVLLAALATGQGTLAARLGLVIVAVGGSILIFKLGLGLPLPLWPS